MVVRKRSAKAPHNPYLTAATPDELGPANRIAYDIIAERRDLLPSVERIMNAGLDADGTVGVLTLFRSSLTAVGDPNRDPRVAIAAYSPASAGAVVTTVDVRGTAKNIDGLTSEREAITSRPSGTQVIAATVNIAG